MSSGEAVGDGDRSQPTEPRPGDPSPRSIESMFEESAVRPACAALPALVDGDDIVTHAELRSAGLAIAGDLVAAGVRPGDAVGVGITRGPEHIVALLGVLMSGAAYVPLGADDPPERVERVVRTTGLEVVVGDAVVDLDGVRRVGVASPAAPPLAAPVEADPTSTAYVLFTSGSTGVPKGVAMPHRSLVNLLHWHRRARPASSQRRTLQFCDTRFDFSFLEIFSTLCSGGCLVLVDDETRQDPIALGRHLARHAVERAFLPVPALTGLVRASEAVDLDLSLVEVITTGERLRIDDSMRRFFAATGASLHNHYGATEFQDAATSSFTGEPALWPDDPSIGAPIDGVQVALLDDERRLIDVGEIGEVYVGGVGLADGYVADPDLTAERFVALPDRPGTWYRTGDCGVADASGVIRLLGRTDDQVKIAGRRVDLQEVTSVFAGQPGVAQVAVDMKRVAAVDRMVVYVLPDASEPAERIEAQLRALASSHWPPVLRPAAYVFVDRIPLTTTGKTDRRALPVPDAGAIGRGRTSIPTVPLERQIARLWGEVLGIDHVGRDDNFFDLGGTSLLVVEVRDQLARRLDVDIDLVDIYRSPTVRALAAGIRATERTGASATVPRRGSGRDIAVVGLSCRVPGAGDAGAFWRNLVEGVESIETGDPAPGRAGAGPHAHDFVAAAASLRDIEEFDANFFGYTAREAALLDPQQRVFLECAWEAMEHAAIPPGSARAGRVGVYAGSSISTYLLNHVAPHHGFGGARPLTETDLLQFQLRLTNDRNYLPTRVSYKLDLTGPSVAVQTACSTSLVAVHLAKSALLSGECDVALAGGVSIAVPQGVGYHREDGLIFSADGHCRAFDAEASGTVFGSGCGVVVLRRLEDAIEDGDDVIAVIRGSAVNNDGASKVGYTAPSITGQSGVIRAALADAGVDPDSVSYVEAHGTATPVGDPIEIAALGDVIGTGTRRDACAIGSVKTNVGHLDEAAGVIGLIKTALALHHGVLPPSLHFECPNPAIDFDRGPFEVVTTARPWSPTGHLRRAGVSSFGMGGTNCHVVLEEAPVRPSSDDIAATDRDPDGVGSAGEPHVLLLSARSDAALATVARRHAALLRDPEVAVADVVATAARGRRHHDRRLAAVGNDRAELLARLGAPNPVRREPPPPRSTVFAFGGQGAQYAGMGVELASSEPVVAEVLDQCDAALRDHLDLPLLDLLSSGSSLTDTALAQPTLFAVELALARWWESRGLVPDLVIGHSIGELVAATFAGVFSVEAGAILAATRGRLMRDLSAPGRMVAVAASEDVVAALLADAGDTVTVAAVNSPQAVVVAGTGPEFDAVLDDLRRVGLRTTELEVSRAFHSPAMAPVLPHFGAAVEGVIRSLPKVPIVSNVYGTIHDPRLVESSYWVDHIAATVRFANGVESAVAAGADVFVEISPRPVLSPSIVAVAPDVVSVASSRAGREVDQIRHATGVLYEAGVEMDWGSAIGPGRTIRLPTYPWQRRRHWVEAPSGPGATPRPRAGADGHPILGEEVELADRDDRWFRAEIGPSQIDWLSQHRVFESVVLPGVAMIDVFLAAGASSGLGDIQVSEFVIHRAMEFDDDSLRRIQVRLRRDGALHHAELHSRADTDDEWTLHAVADLSAAPHDLAESALVPLPRSSEFERDVAAIFAGERARSIDLGPAFEVANRLWVDGRRARSEIDGTIARSGHLVHPTVLESCFLAITMTYPERCRERTYVPSSVGEIVFRRSAGAPVDCRVTLRESPEVDPQVLLADAELVDADGREVIVLRGVVLQRADRGAMLRSPRTRLLHQVVWVPADAVPSDTVPPDTVPWFVVGGGAIGDAVAAALRDAGIACRFGDVHDTSDPAIGVVVDCNTLAPAPEHPVARALAVAPRVLSTLATVAASDRPPAVLIVTTGALDAHPDPVAAAVGGLVRSARSERPDLGHRLVDVSAVDAVTIASVLMREVHRQRDGDGEDEVSTGADGVRCVPRLRALATPEPTAFALDPDGTHLVAGGLGAIGRHVVRALAASGAAHIAVVGRHASPSVVAALVDETGAHIEHFVADVSDRDALARVVAGLDGSPEWPRLRGVFHLAGAIDDGLVTDLDDGRVATVFGGKAAGAWWLHELTLASDLEHFVLFSSVSGLLGSPGQASYAAANCFIDAVAVRRRADGLPAVSVQWCSWAGTGMSADPAVEARLERSGERSLAPDDAIDAMTAVLGSDVGAVIAVSPIDWQRFAERQFRVPSLLRDLVSRPRTAALPARRRLEAVPAALRRALLLAHVRAELAACIGDDLIGDDDGFFAAGLDSLGSIELRNRLQVSLEIPLPQTLAFDHPTVTGLVEFLWGDLFGEPAATTEAADEAVPSTAAERLAAKLGLEVHDGG